MTKSMWSVPCWYFFHGFAARIDENFYKENYIQIWKEIYRNMCYNLPCSICKGHATRYISNVRLSDINTKHISSNKISNIDDFIHQTDTNDGYQVSSKEVKLSLPGVSINLPINSKNLQSCIYLLENYIDSLK